MIADWFAHLSTYMRLKDLACIGEQQNSKRRVADVVDGVDDIVANGRRGELEPVADAEGVLDVQRGFESAANGWLRRVAALDTVYDRTTCNFATIDFFPFFFLLTALMYSMSLMSVFSQASSTSAAPAPTN